MEGQTDRPTTPTAETYVPNTPTPCFLRKCSTRKARQIPSCSEYYSSYIAPLNTFFTNVVTSSSYPSSYSSSISSTHPSSSHPLLPPTLPLLLILSPLSRLVLPNAEIDAYILADADKIMCNPAPQSSFSVLIQILRIARAGGWSQSK